jgi:hypothetical protein
MRGLAIPAFVFLAALGAQVDAGQAPTSASLVDRHKSSSFTHYVRGEQGLPQAASLVDRHKPSSFTHYVRGN